MQRKIALVLVLLLIVLLCGACESKQVSEAKTAFLEGRYGDVISLLKEQDVLEDDSLLRIWKLSTAAVAYDAGEYQKVVDSLHGIDISQELYFADLLLFSNAFLEFNQGNHENVVELLSGKILRDDEALNDIYNYSNAYLAYQNEDNLLVLDYLGENTRFSDDEIVLGAWKKVVLEAITEKNAETLCRYIDNRNSPTEFIYSIIARECESFNYDAFLIMDYLMENTKNEDLIERFQSFLKDNVKTRTKAFLKGTWELQSKNENKTTVNIHVVDDDTQCVGVVVKVGDDEKIYKFFSGEVYWKEFIFEDGMLVGLFNQAKTQYGDAVGLQASVKVFFAPEVLNIQLPNKSASGLRVVNRDRTWVKISSE